MKKKNLLLVTDFYYQAKGREYYKEDLELSSYLRNFFKLSITHIKDINVSLDGIDAVLIRNTGPQVEHFEMINLLKLSAKIPLSNDLQGKGDILGKRHLIDLYQCGYPVIPSIDSFSNLELLGHTNQYLLKPKEGCDSAGVKIVHYDELKRNDDTNTVIQPLLNFEYEISFYFIDQTYQYALYAPQKLERWKLELYSASESDIQFAQKFIDWNTCHRGIQRVDACRLKSGHLLLMELEDYNPYLSINCLSDSQKMKFVDTLRISLQEQIEINEKN